MIDYWLINYDLRCIAIIFTCWIVGWGLQALVATLKAVFRQD
jgi:hypothetical protein